MGVLKVLKVLTSVITIFKVFINIVVIYWGC